MSIKSLKTVLPLLALFCFMAVAPALAQEYITTERAKAIALQDAGLNESQAAFVKVARYSKHMAVVYGLVFLTDNAKYNYEVDAVSGNIVASYQHHRDGYRNPGNVKEIVPEYPVHQFDPAHYIGGERAKQIAFDHAKVDEQGVYKFDMHLDYEDGRMVYEIDFKYGRMEYEYEIDAVTGAIVSVDIDRD